MDEAVNIAGQLAEGLQEAHESGIVHRDIKSANVMVDTKGKAKILDFGLAKLAGHTRLTRTATIMGTVAYMSPEQARGESVDHRTDIWSLGVVLYEMLTGKLPFDANNEAVMIHKILHESPAEVTTLNPETPPGLDVVVSRAMAKEKEDRYASISELLQDIRNFRSLQPREFRSIKEKTREEDPDAYRRAEKRVRSKLRFYRHLEFFLAVNGLLLLINLLTSHRYFWFKWPLFALGIPLCFHWLIVFGLSKRASFWERVFEKELNEEASKKG